MSVGLCLRAWLSQMLLTNLMQHTCSLLGFSVSNLFPGSLDYCGLSTHLRLDDIGRLARPGAGRESFPPASIKLENFIQTKTFALENRLSSIGGRCACFTVVTFLLPLPEPWKDLYPVFIVKNRWVPREIPWEVGILPRLRLPGLSCSYPSPHAAFSNP